MTPKVKLHIAASAVVLHAFLQAVFLVLLLTLWRVHLGLWVWIASVAMLLVVLSVRSLVQGILTVLEIVGKEQHGGTN